MLDFGAYTCRVPPVRVRVSAACVRNTTGPISSWVEFSGASDLTPSDQISQQNQHFEPYITRALDSADRQRT